MKKLISTLFILFVAVSCYAPPQDFTPGSEAYILANPNLELTQNYLEKNGQKHEVLIGVIDGGVDYNHKQLRENIHPVGQGVGHDLLGHDFLPFPKVINPEDLQDISKDLEGWDHGTHVAGLATLGGIFTREGEKLKFKERIGLVPLRILPLDNRDIPLSDDDPFGFSMSEEDSLLLYEKILNLFKDAIKLAIEEKVSVVNMSVGLNSLDKGEEISKKVIARAKLLLGDLFIQSKDSILYVFAAGNESYLLPDDWSYVPGSIKLENALTVGALANNKIVAEYSNYGKNVDVFIRGSDINSTVPENLRDKMSGTSMATPLVSNLAAKVKIVAPCLSAPQIKELILKCSKLTKLPVENDLEKIMEVKVVQFQKTLRSAQGLCQN